MPTLSLPLAIRPVRVGILISTQTTDDIVRAATICSGLWGGIFNYLIPITEYVDSAIQSLAVDVLVTASGSPEAEAILDRYEHLQLRTLSIEHQSLFSTDSRGDIFSTLADIVYPVYQHWWDEGRHASTPQAVLPIWPSSHPKRALLATTFGVFPPPGSDLPDLAAVFSHSFGADAQEVSGAPEAAWAAATTPIQATRLDLSLWGRFSPFEAGLVVGDPGNALHLAAFWNLRASGRAALFCPRTGPDAWTDFLREFLRLNISTADQAEERWARLWICVDDDYEDPEIPESFATLTPEGVKTLVERFPVHQARFYRDESRAQTEWTTVLASVDDRFGTKYVTASPSSPFPDARRDLAPRRQLWFVCFSSQSMWDLAEGWTLKLPKVPALNEWLAREMVRTSSGALRVQAGGFDVIDHATSGHISISPIPSRDLVASIFSNADIEMTLKTPGQIAYRILDMIGDRHWSRVFRIRGVRELISSRQARTGLAFSRAVELIRDKDPATKVSSFDRFESFGGRDSTPESVFRQLLEWEVFRPQLSLVCPNCALTTNIEADSVGNRVTCTLCSHQFLLGPQLTGKEWRFRISGVFEREGGPEGVISTLLSWGELERAGGIGDELLLFPAHDLAGDGLRCETDLVALEVSPNTGNPSICVGECKTKGRIEETDLANLTEVRRRLRASGIETYIVLAIQRDSFDDAEMRMLTEFTKRVASEEDALGVPFYETREATPFILITRRELEMPPWTSAPAIEGVPHRYPMSFRDLAENSKVGHLGLALWLRSEGSG